MVAPATRSEGRVVRLLVWIPIFSIVAIDAGYLAIISNQGELPADILTVPFVAVYLGVMAAMLAVSLLDRPAVRALRHALRGAASAGTPDPRLCTIAAFARVLARVGAQTRGIRG